MTVSRRRALITGGGGAIGAACASLLGRSGCDIVLAGRDSGRLDAAVANLTTSGVAARPYPCDVTHELEVQQMLADLGRVDILVASAGQSSSAPLARTTAANVEALWRVNALGSFLCAREALPTMRAQNHGRIVFVASIAGLRGNRYTAAYTSAKHAAVGFMRVLAAEVAGTGITSNAVCPSYVDSPMTTANAARVAQDTRRSEAEILGSMTAQSGLRRLVDPAEVAAAVAFLCSDGAAAINGQSVVLDGGGQA